MGRHSSFSSLLALVTISSLLVAGCLPLCKAYHQYGQHSTTGFSSFNKEVYVVHLDDSSRPDSHTAAEARHHDILASLHSSQDLALQSRLYSYKHIFDGFSAVLTPLQATSVAAMPEVHSVYPNKVLNLQTTRSWDFLGLSSELNGSGLAQESNYGQDIIVGTIDSGIWPESPSFSDESFTPVPSRWKGKCVDGEKFVASEHCNKKIIGAQYFIKAFLAANRTLDASRFMSARDSDGHGTHTASTLAGRYVNPVDLFGQAKGAARGGAPLARLAIYKACWPDCFTADLLAAFDAAIEDGVDILSLSLASGPPQTEYYEDPLAIAAFQAMRRGILSVCASGNSGPAPSSSTSIAPWILSVAATSIDRKFPTTISLGNNVTLKGTNAINQHTLLSDSWYPLIMGIDAALDGDHTFNASQCIPGSLNSDKVAGKIVVCEITANFDATLKINVILEAGGFGVIVSAVDVDDSVFSLPIPFALVDGGTIVTIKEYVKDNVLALGKIGATQTEQTSAIKAPVVAGFSSRGPNLFNQEILKPDISAPGVSIIAAFSPAGFLNEFPSETRRVNYIIESGTSMATPHVAALAALIKAVRPTWSPAAIKSAIMTTADRLDNTGQPISDKGNQGGFAGPFAMGAGQINPNRAANPGLILDVSENDYALLLCASHYNSTTLKLFMGSDFVCPSSVPQPKDFNYPAIHFIYGSHGSNNTILRTVTNVGKAKSIYRANVLAPPGTKIIVQPSELSFSSLNQQLNFTTILVGENMKTGANKTQIPTTSTGTIVWVDTEKYYSVNIVVVVST